MDSWLEDKPVWHRRADADDGASWSVAVFALAGIGILGAIGYALFSLLGDSAPGGAPVVHISLIKPPPMPPPPPPPEVKELPKPKPEVPVEQPPLPEPVKPPEPVAAPTAPPALDTGMTGNSGSYDLGARLGGKDITIGGGGGDQRARSAWFIGQVRTQIEKHLQSNERLRMTNYRAAIAVWLAPDGTLSRIEIIGSSGDAGLDREIAATLQSMPKVQPSMPAELAQPVKLRITSRGAG